MSHISCIFGFVSVPRGFRSRHRPPASLGFHGEASTERENVGGGGGHTESGGLSLEERLWHRKEFTEKEASTSAKFKLEIGASDVGGEILRCMRGYEVPVYPV